MDKKGAGDKTFCAGLHENRKNERHKIRHLHCARKMEIRRAGKERTSMAAQHTHTHTHTLSEES